MLAPKLQPFFRFELRHSKQVTEYFEIVTLGEFAQVSKSFRDEGRGLIRAPLPTRLVM